MSGDRDPTEWADPDLKKNFDDVSRGFAFGGNGRVQVASVKQRHRWTRQDFAALFLGLGLMVIPAGLATFLILVLTPLVGLLAAALISTLIELPFAAFLFVAGLAVWAKS